MRTKVYPLAGLTAAAASVAALQLPSAGVALTLAASPFNFGTQATLSGTLGRYPFPAVGAPMEITITSLGGSPAQVYTVIGRDRWGQPLTAQVVSAGGALVVRSGQVWSQIISITPSATDGANNISVGTPQRVTTPWVQVNQERGFDQANIAYVSVDGIVGAPTYTLESTAASLNEEGVGPLAGNVVVGSSASLLHGFNLPTYYGDNAPIDATSNPTTFPQLAPQGGQWVRLIITSVTGTSVVSRFVRPGY